MQISELMDSARQVFSGCPEAELFPKIRRAVVELANMGLWDWMTCQQYITFNVELSQLQRGYITLPRFVDMPQAMNLDCNPAFPRSKWFVHHFNGPGDRSNFDCNRYFWDDKGEFPVIRLIPVPTKLTAQNYNSGDASVQIRVYGLDQFGNEVFSEDGKPGILLSMGVPSSVLFTSVTQVYKPVTLGVITMAQDDLSLLGFYYPDETTPQYRRVHIPKKCRTVTITYKRSITPITCVEDWIPLNNMNAIIAGMQYIYQLDKLNPEEAEKYRAIAKRSLNDEQDTRTLQTPVGPQIQNLTKRTGNDRLYGRSSAGVWNGSY